MDKTDTEAAVKPSKNVDSAPASEDPPNATKPVDLNRLPEAKPTASSENDSADNLTAPEVIPKQPKDAVKDKQSGTNSAVKEKQQEAASSGKDKQSMPASSGTPSESELLSNSASSSASRHGGSMYDRLVQVRLFFFFKNCNCFKLDELQLRFHEIITCKKRLPVHRTENRVELIFEGRERAHVAKFHCPLPINVTANKCHEFALSLG